MRLILLLSLACGRAPSTSPPAPEPTPAVVQTLGEAPVEATSPHPGTVTIVDLNTETTREERADALSERLIWAVVDGVPVPVTRIESRRDKDGVLYQTKFGADGKQIGFSVKATRPEGR